MPNSKPNTVKKNKKRRPKGNGTTAVAPVAKTTSRPSTAPRMHGNGKSTSISHREYVTDITSTNGGYRVSGFAINPGVSTTFPWLSTIASRYESYIFERLDFVYQPICPTTTPGSIMMATDFDAGDPAPPNKVIIMSYHGATRTAPWNNTTYKCASLDLRKFGIQRYVRTATNPAGSDIKTYDVGNFYIALQNLPAADTACGELYVDYAIRFYTPQITPGITLSVPKTAVQSGTINVPASGAASLVSTVYTLGNQPLAWLLDPGAGTAPPILMLDLNGTNGLRFKQFVKGVAGPVLQRYNNMSLGTVGSPFNILQLSTALSPGAINTTDWDRDYFFTPNGTGTTQGGGLYPFPLFRAAVPYNLSFVIEPIVARMSSTDMPSYPIPALGTNWNFPPIDIPTLGSGSLPGRTTFPKDSKGNTFTVEPLSD